MASVQLPYVDSALEHMDQGGPTAYWHNLHWGLYDDPATDDDSTEGYVRAAVAMTQAVTAAADLGDDRRILDVGCGFGGTLAHVRDRRRGCRLSGVNIDLRQLRWARRMLDEGAGPTRSPIALVTADGCRLPVASGSVDHILAVECVFHFPSRKGFFREAARALKPGGTLALTDFLLSPGGLAQFLALSAELAPSDWYGHSSTPITSAAYERLGRATGFEPLVDDDVTTRTLPTYPARRRLYLEAWATDGAANIDKVEALARDGAYRYHVLAFRRTG